MSSVVTPIAALKSGLNGVLPETFIGPAYNQRWTPHSLLPGFYGSFPMFQTSPPYTALGCGPVSGSISPASTARNLTS